MLPAVMIFTKSLGQTPDPTGIKILNRRSAAVGFDGVLNISCKNHLGKNFVFSFLHEEEINFDDAKGN